MDDTYMESSIGLIVFKYPCFSTNNVFHLGALLKLKNKNAAVEKKFHEQQHTPLANHLDPFNVYEKPEVEFRLKGKQRIFL